MGGNDVVETITVNQPVELMNSDTFSSNINLRYVDFRSGITGITEQTFWNCSKLERTNTHKKNENY